MLSMSQNKKQKKKRGKRGRNFWVQPLSADTATSSAYQSLVLKMKEMDRLKFFGFVCMSPNPFHHLLELVKPMITIKNAVSAPTPPEECLAFTLRFLASRESQTSLSYHF